MALDQSASLDVLELLKGTDVEERIEQAATTIYQALVEAKSARWTAPGPHERSHARTAQRNGHRNKTITTTSGRLGTADPEAADRLVLSELAGVAQGGWISRYMQ